MATKKKKKKKNMNEVKSKTHNKTTLAQHI